MGRRSAADRWRRHDRNATGRLAGRVCVVAGVCGAIGEAVADRLRGEGATVIGIDRKEHAVGVRSLRADLTVEREVEQAFAAIQREFGRVDVLFNNAGLSDPLDHSARHGRGDVAAGARREPHDDVPDVQARDPIHALERSPSGSVINTASFLAVMGAATAQMAYSAAKAAVIQLSRDLGTQLARSGVRVNALCLGPIDMPQLRALFDRLEPDELPKRLIHYPMGRFGRLDELAATVAYLASDDSGFVTASAFPLSGGITTAFTVPERPAP